MMKGNLKKQKGTALIMVVLIAALVIVLVVESVKKIQHQSRLSSNLINRDQAYSYLMGMEELAKIYLKKAFENTKEETVHLNQLWAQEDITFPLDGGGMTASIKDMQSCFNLNSVIGTSNNRNNRNGNDNAERNPGTGNQNTTPNRNNNVANNERDGAAGDELPGQKALEELIEKVKEDSSIIGKDLATAVRDWMDGDMIEAGPSGAEDAYYQGLEIPYRTANDLIAHESELLTIRGFNRKIYSALRPLVCVLPDKDINQINVNTVTEENSALLFAVIDSREISESDIKKAISERPEEGYETVAQFFEGTGLRDLRSDGESRLTVNTNFFQMSAKAEIGKTRVAMKTLFQKEEDNSFKVVSRYFGRE